MSNSTRYGGLGCRRDEADRRDRICRVEPPGETPLPDVVDLRKGFAPAWNQGKQGCCSGHAVSAAVQYMDFDCFPKDGGLDARPSPRYAYYHARDDAGMLPEDSGASIRDIVKTINSYGICPEPACPYDPRDWTTPPSPAADEAAALHKALLYERVPQDLRSLKTTLAQSTPIVCGIVVTESFETPFVAATGMVPMPAGDVMGGHAVVIAGYDDTRQGCIVRNSWGGRWGIEGYCVIPFEYILDPDLSFDFWTVNAIE